jgi:hypothetical protein
VVLAARTVSAAAAMIARELAANKRVLEAEPLEAAAGPATMGLLAAACLKAAVAGRTAGGAPTEVVNPLEEAGPPVEAASAVAGEAAEEADPRAAVITAEGTEAAATANAEAAMTA